MKSMRRLLSLSLLATVAVASAQSGYTQVSASAGSVAALGPSGSWSGLTGSASRATVAYGYQDSNVTPPNAFKFATSSAGEVTGKTLSGYSDESPTGFVDMSGASTVNPSTIDLNYYTVDWTSSLYRQDPSTPASAGTFDPFDVRYGDVSGQVGPAGGTVDLYFQSGLQKKGYDGNTFLIASAGTIAEYGYHLYVTDANHNATNVLNVGFSTATGLSISFNPASGIDLYLLGSNANVASASPTARIGAGTAILTQSQATSALSPYFYSDGRLTQDLNFGLVRHQTIVPGGNPNDLLFEWHADTTNAINPQAVPEPAAFAALGLGAAGLLRRRRRH